MKNKTHFLCFLVALLVLTLTMGLIPMAIFASETNETASTSEVSMNMTESEKSSMQFVSSGTVDDVFSYTTDDSKDVLKIYNAATSWTHDSVLINGHQFSNVIIETTFRHDTSDSSKNGFPLIVMRRTDASTNYAQVGGGIGIGFLNGGENFLIYDSESDAYTLQGSLEEGLYNNDDYNTVKIMSEGNGFMIFLNGKYVMTYNHSKGLLAEYGYVGIASSNAIVYVDSFKVSQFEEKTLTVSKSNKFYDFKSTEQFADFESYYLASNTTGKAVQDTAIINDGGKWTADTEAGTICAHTFDSSQGQQVHITSLYLKDVFLSNFDMSVDFKSNTNSNWMTLTGKIITKGYPGARKGYNYGGSFSTFIQDNGIALFSSYEQGDLETSAVLPFTKKGEWHNIRVVCVGLETRLYIDHQLIYTNYGEFYGALGGYLGMQVMNDNGLYSNFSVTALDEYGNPAAIGSQNDKIKVAAVGDSITYGSGAKNEEGKYDATLSYPSQLGKLLGSEYDVRNFGISGRHIIDGGDCYTDEAAYQGSLLYKPDIVLAMFGTNDIKDANWVENNGVAAAARYVANYKALIAKYREVNPDVEIFVMTSPKLYYEIEGTLSGTKLAEVIIPLQRQIAKETESHLIDIFELTKDWAATSFPDSIHPNAAGYETLAGEIYEDVLSGLNASFPFDVSELDYVQTYSDNFDGKSKEEIYSEWNGVHKADRSEPVSSDGWLTANWDLTTGVGYSFKQSYRNAIYDFDVKYTKDGTTSHATFVLRSLTNAGTFYGGMQSGSTSSGVNGVAFSYHNSSATSGNVTITIANSSREVMNTCTTFELPYPDGVDFLTSTSVTVYDLDDWLLFFVENEPFAAIKFGGLTDELYTQGEVFDGSGESLGTFEKTVRRESCFAITARYTTIFLDNLTISEENTTSNVDFDVSELDYVQTYSNNFDGKSKEEIYSEWNGVHKADRSEPVSSDGWLTANWDTTTGVGYSFKQSYRNAIYDFDVKYTKDGTTSHATFVLRSLTNAGTFYGGMQSGSTSSGVNGVAFSYHNSSATSGNVTITIANSSREVMNTCTTFELPYPDGVDFLTSTSVTVYDLDEWLLFFVENEPFAAIKFGGLTDEFYTQGEVFDGSGKSLGTFEKTVRRESCFAITARYTTIFLDNFTISEDISISSIDTIQTSVVYGTTYAQALNKLPNRVLVEFADGEKRYMNVTWDESSSTYSGNKAGEYEIYGKFSSDEYSTETVTAKVNVLEEIEPIEEGETVLYQYMPYVDELNMSYIVKTKTNKLIVIDGGRILKTEDSSVGLLNELKRISGSEHPVVDAWIFTHMHSDHVLEFVRIANENLDEITVKNIYMNFPDQEDAYKLETPADNDDLYNKFTDAYDKIMGEGAFASYKKVQRGDVIVVDDVVFEIMHVLDGSEPSINDTSIVFRMTADGQSVLFFGDLAVTAGERLYADWGDKLKSDIVQMAHHGQDGVAEYVYQAVDPDICLWPTPNWLWDCQEGGSYKTWMTKEWLAKLDVKRHVVAGIEGTVALTFPLDLNTYQTTEIISVGHVSNVYVEVGGTLPSLPTSVKVVDNLLNERTIEIVWESNNIDTSVAGEYILTGDLSISADERLQNSEGFKATVKVIVSDENTTLNVDFENNITDFDSYYIANTSASMQGVASNYIDNWKIENGQLVRINGLSGNSGGTNSVAILTYSKQKFRDFNLSVDVIMGTDSHWWPVITVLQSDNKGEYFLSDGLGLFVQTSGIATIWGKNTGNPIESSAISGYKNNVMHNMEISVIDGHVSFYVDGVLAIDYYIPESMATEGYISLMSVNNGCTFANLIIREYIDPSEISDLTALNEAISQAEELDKTKFFYGWEDLQTALERAKQISKYDEQEEVNAAAETLLSAIQNLIAYGDPTALRSAVDTGLTITASKYTKASFSVFETALDSAEAILKSPTSQEVLDSMLDTLNAARQALVELGDKTQLTATIAEIEELESGKYTEQSWAVLISALEDAKTVAGKEEAIQSEIDSALKILELTYGELEEIETEPPQETYGDPTALRSAVDTGLTITASKYTKASFSVFETALDSAEAILKSPTSQEVLDSMLDTLNAARQALVALGDKTQLTATIAEIEELESSKYTEQSWAVLISALEEAKTVAGKEEAIQSEIDSALRILELTYGELEEIETEPPQETIGGCSSSSYVNGATMFAISVLVTFVVIAEIARKRHKKV